MTVFKVVHPKDVIMGKLRYGADLLDALTAIAMERDIRLGRVEAIGAVQKANISFYQQHMQTYQPKTLDKPMEIVQLSGNVSLKNGRPFVHAHITLTDEEGNMHGGHLCRDTIVFACEFMIQSFDGPELNREHDEQTGLPLWALLESSP